MLYNSYNTLLMGGSTESIWAFHPSRGNKVPARSRFLPGKQDRHLPLLTPPCSNTAVQQRPQRYVIKVCMNDSLHLFLITDLLYLFRSSECPLPG